MLSVKHKHIVQETILEYIRRVLWHPDDCSGGETFELAIVRAIGERGEGVGGKVEGDEGLVRVVIYF